MREHLELLLLESLPESMDEVIVDEPALSDRVALRDLVDERETPILGRMSANDVEASPDFEIHSLELVTRPDSAPMGTGEEIKRECLINIPAQAIHRARIDFSILAAESLKSRLRLLQARCSVKDPVQLRTDLVVLFFRDAVENVIHFMLRTALAV